MFGWIDTDMGFRWNVANIWRKLTRPFRNFFWWIVKSVQYSILLWNDFDWDYHYILTLLQYKIRRTRKRILANNIILRSEEVAAQMKHAEDLIQRLFDSDFCKQLQEAHEEKWGPIVDFSKEIQVGGRTLHQLEVVREKATTPELQKQEQAEQSRIYNLMNKEEQECWDELFDHMKEHMREWWD